jgi:hypothetical protein
MPECGVSSSISEPVGQPLPGSSASKVENPVEMVGPVRALNCDPRQSAGCSLSSEADEQGGGMAEIGMVRHKSNNTVQIYSIIGFIYQAYSV